MHPVGRPLREVVFELSTPPSTRVDNEAAATALRNVPGVHEAHVDLHRTWAMVAFDPTVATVPSIIGCLGAHGLEPSRMRNLRDSASEERPG